MRKLIALILIFSFFFQQTGFASTVAGSSRGDLNLPYPQDLLSLSTQPFNPPTLRGLKIYPEEPLKFDFILDEGDNKLSNEELKTASESLIKHFLAYLTIPEEDLWGNLSPKEPDRIVPEAFGLTETGQELLAQDYILKQLMSSVIYPENSLGREFWNKVYSKAAQLYGTANIPINTATRIWIVPDKAQVFEDETKAILGETKLKVMLEEEYLLIKDSPQSTANSPQIKKLTEQEKQEINSFSSQIMKEVVIPEIEKEVNLGKNFTELRQIYHALILATWLKQKLMESAGKIGTDTKMVSVPNFPSNPLSQVYIDQKKIKGVDSSDPKAKEKIYSLYLEAFRKGAYDYIKKDTCPRTHKTVKRRYFTGGVAFAGDIGNISDVVRAGSSPMGDIKPERVDPTLETTPLKKVTIGLSPEETTASPIEDIIMGTPETVVYLHRTTKDSADKILKTGLKLGPNEISSTATVTSTDKDTAKKIYDLSHKGDTHVVVIEFPRGSLEDTGMPRLDEQVAALLEAEGFGAFRPEGYVIPVYYIKGYIDRETQEFIANENFRSSAVPIAADNSRGTMPESAASRPNGSEGAPPTAGPLGEGKSAGSPVTPPSAIS